MARKKKTSAPTNGSEPKQADNVAVTVEPTVDGKAPSTPTQAPYRLQVSPHTLAIALDCRTRLALQLGGLTDAAIPPASSSLSAIAGSAGHKALAAWILNDSWLAAMDYYKADSTELGINHDRRGYPNMVKVLDSWTARWIHRDRMPFESYEVDGKPLVEQSFVAPIGEIDTKAGRMPVDLIGYMDWVVRDKASGLIVPAEHKFTGMLDSRFVARFNDRDPQVPLYMIALKQILGIDALTGWVNAIEMEKVPDSNRPCARHGVPYSECGADGLVREPHVKATLIPVRRTLAQLDEFRAMVLDISSRYIAPVALAVARRGSAIATKTPREGPFTGACDWCEFYNWCLTNNRSPNKMATMLTGRNRDPYRLASGLVSRDLEVK